MVIDTTKPIKLRKSYKYLELNVEERSNGYDMPALHYIQILKTF